MKHSALAGGASLVALLLGSAAVTAAPVSLQVCSEGSCWSGDYLIADGVVVNWSDVETMSNGSSSVNDWEGTHGLDLSTWTLSMDSEPFVTNNFTLTNTTTSVQTYTINSTIGITPAIADGRMRGSVGFSLTDNNNDGATLAASGGSIYTALIDGNTARTLWPVPASYATFSTTVNSIDFGFPTREVAPESADTNFGITLMFSLTPGDSVAFTSNFDIVPVPLPAGGWLLGSGILGLAGAFRRRNT